MSLLPVEEALAAILARVPAPVAETVPLAQAHGRVLAEPLIAGHSQPPFDASAMDGYAVRADDVVPGEALKLVGVAQAGQRFAGLMGQGQCVRIFTGAPMPIGADTVIMQEEAQADGYAVRFARTPARGHSVRPAGYDFARGQELLAAGQRLTPSMLALAASANRAELAVARGLKIAVLATGDELVAPGQDLLPDQIVASNNFGLLPLAAPYARELVDLGTAPDQPGDIRARLASAVDGRADVVITTGGASVGDRDYMREVLLDLGVMLDFWKINMRPGKPLMFGTHGQTLVFGLPGNPVSAMVTAEIFIKPALRRWLGLAELGGRRMRLPLLAPTPPNGARRHFMRGSFGTDSEGMTGVLPISQTDSGHLSSLALADVLIVQNENDPGQPAGQAVDVIVFNAF